MGSKQGAETRRQNDILRFLETETFNLGIEDEQEKDTQSLLETEIRHHYQSPKVVSAFATRLNELLDEHNTNKTQLGRDIAKHIGHPKPIARQTIDNYASGKTSPTLDIILYMCDYFGVSCDYLVGLSDSVTVEDKYITETLGLTQESIDFLRCQRDNKYTVDTINLLIKDRREYIDYIKAKKAKSAPPIQKGFNVLYHLHRYLDVKTNFDLYSISYDDWEELKERIDNLLDELELDNKDQTIGEYRRKAELLNDVYKKLMDDKKVTLLKEERITGTLFKYVENTLKSLRKLLLKNTGQL